jgi:hypothetical protein
MVRIALLDFLGGRHFTRVGAWGAVVEDEGQTPVRAADVDVKKTAVGAFELVGVGHVDKVVMPPPGSQGKPTSSTQRSQGIRST